MLAVMRAYLSSPNAHPFNKTSVHALVLPAYLLAAKTRSTKLIMLLWTAAVNEIQLTHEPAGESFDRSHVQSSACKFVDGL